MTTADPFLIDPPFRVAFSGGRTSGYMLWRIVQAHGGRMPAGSAVIFCNTGKEEPQTLDFVERCSQRWGVKVVWLEFTGRGARGFKEVNYATASRDGEPFAALIRTKQRLPNVVQRSCTQWLKILTAHRFVRNELGWPEYTTAIGLRADEPDRVRKLAPHPDLTPGEEPSAPLANAGVALADVLAFWRGQAFDLELSVGDSNCDLCFLKGRKRRAEKIRLDPAKAVWWAEQERWVGEKTGNRAHATFTKGQSYEALTELALAGADQPDDLFADCRCTD